MLIRHEVITGVAFLWPTQEPEMKPGVIAYGN